MKNITDTKIKMSNNKLGFTILEYVVILFVIVLITSIAYSSFLVFSKNSRDTTRKVDLSYIGEGLNNYKTKNELLPFPNLTMEVTSSGKTINNQGFMSRDILETIGLNETLIDPDRNIEYTYVTDAKYSKYQLMALVENNWNESPDINFEKRIPYTYGSELGVFLNIVDNKPVQEISEDNIELQTVDMDRYIVFMNDDLYATGNDIKKEMSYRINPIANCLHILKNGESVGDGVYTISPDNDGLIDVYCDMTTDGGGWTLFYANNGIEDSPIAESYVEMRNNVESGETYDLTDYSGSTLAGLIDYNYFTENGAKEVLMKNHAVTDESWGKVFFDSSDTLNWALGDEVLGSGIEKCIDLPEGATWGIISNTGKETYANLTQMMAHGGTSWGISHEKYDCNGYIETSILPHLAFYGANNSTTDNRARSNTVIGGTWGGENEYRYFIR